MVKTLDDRAISKAMTEEDHLPVVAFGVTGVEDESGTGRACIVESLEAARSRQMEELHGRHCAEVGLELSGEEFGRAFLITPIHGDGVAGD